MTTILEINNLNYQYKDTTVFHNFNLKIDSGSYISIAGNNTSGKTTLIKLISGLIPNNDSICFKYSFISKNYLNDYTKEIGVVFGDKLNSFLFDDVYKEMAFPLENLNMGLEEIDKRIIEITRLFGITKLLDRKITDLTNNEKQLLLLAISILHKPKLLLLDNPFSMLDYEQKKKVRKILKQYQKKSKLTILLTTTNLEDTLDSDYLYIINNGNILIEGTPLTVLKKDTLLNHLGLSVPFMADLSLKLEFYGLLDRIELDMNRMVDNLWK